MINEEMEKLFPECPPFKCRSIGFVSYGEDDSIDGQLHIEVTQDNLELIKKYIECIEESLNG